MSDNNFKKGYRRMKHTEYSSYYQSTLENLFNSLDVQSKGYIYKKSLIEALNLRGIVLTDLRIKATVDMLHDISDSEKINFDRFQQLVLPNVTIIEKALTGDLVIPDFASFKKNIRSIYDEIKLMNGGKVADYIPQLARFDPDYFAISVCSIDGQQLHIGDCDIAYSVQSTSKPINYAIALEEFGIDIVHNHIGQEPSGQGFNELTLNKDGLPHNPMINAGAIMSCSLIRPDLSVSDRFDHVLGVWKSLSGNSTVGFNNSIYLSEKQTADRNFALAYFMREHKAFPKQSNMLETLDFYFQGCSIELNSQAHCIVAATFANAGICPITGERVFSAATTKHVLSLMYSCGMYDFSGEFAFHIGIPAKSGVSGALILVVPGVCGITIWSPPLDRYGNSVKAVEVSKQLVNMFNFHTYDNLIPDLDKINPRLQKNEHKNKGIMAANYAASQGDLNELKSLQAKGVHLNDTDYDGRTPLHLAAAEGHQHIVAYFIQQGLTLNPQDRWGGTPLDDAKQAGHEAVVSLLREEGSSNGDGQ